MKHTKRQDKIETDKKTRETRNKGTIQNGNQQRDKQTGNQHKEARQTKNQQRNKTNFKLTKTKQTRNKGTIKNGNQERDKTNWKPT